MTKRTPKQHPPKSEHASQSKRHYWFDEKLLFWERELCADRGAKPADLLRQVYHEAYRRLEMRRAKVRALERIANPAQLDLFPELGLTPMVKKPPTEASVPIGTRVTFCTHSIDAGRPHGGTITAYADGLYEIQADDNKGTFPYLERDVFTIGAPAAPRKGSLKSGKRKRVESAPIEEHTLDAMLALAQTLGSERGIEVLEGKHKDRLPLPKTPAPIEREYAWMLRRVSNNLNRKLSPVDVKMCRERFRKSFTQMFVHRPAGKAKAPPEVKGQLAAHKATARVLTKSDPDALAKALAEVRARGEGDRESGAYDAKDERALVARVKQVQAFVRRTYAKTVLPEDLSHEAIAEHYAKGFFQADEVP